MHEDRSGSEQQPPEYQSARPASHDDQQWREQTDRFVTRHDTAYFLYGLSCGKRSMKELSPQTVTEYAEREWSGFWRSFQVNGKRVAAAL